MIVPYGADLTNYNIVELRSHFHNPPKFGVVF